MRVFQIITRSDTIGGAQKHVIDLSSHLLTNDIDVSIISQNMGPLKEMAEKKDIPYLSIDTMCRDLSILSDLRSIVKIRKLVKRDNPDIVALHSAKTGLLGRIACIGLNTNVVFTAHGWSHIRAASRFSRVVYIFIEKYLSKVSDKLICVSKSDVEYAINEIGIDASKVYHIYNGTESQSDYSTRCNKICGSLKLLSVVRFQKPKDFVTLIEGLSLVKNQEWNLVIVGDGDDKESVVSLINTYGLSDKIRLAGFSQCLDEFYQDSDALVLISHSEGLPMSIIEAMSFGKAVIASDVGGVSELVNNGENGFLIEPKDSKMLADRVSQLFNNANVNNMGKESRKLYLANFTLNKMCNETVSLYSRL